MNGGYHINCVLLYLHRMVRDRVLVKNILHILLASLVLLSSTGLVTHMHFCQNELENYSFFLEPDTCPKEVVKIPCPMHEGMEIEMESEKGCCDDETHYVKLSIEQEAQSLHIDYITDFLFAYLPNTLGLTEAEFYLKSAHYLNYKPPLITCDVQSRLQVFLC